MAEEDGAAGGEGGGEDAAVERARASAWRLGYNPQRIPSWCDRVLWRSYPMCSCEQTAYRAVPYVDTSDHTPVASTFAVRVMLPADAESKATGDLYQWELAISSVSMDIPLGMCHGQPKLLRPW